MFLYLRSHKKSSRRSSSSSSSSDERIRKDEHKKSSSSKSHTESGRNRSRSRSKHDSRDRSRDRPFNPFRKPPSDNQQELPKDRSKKRDKHDKKSSHKSRDRKKSKRSSSSDSNSSASSSSSLKLLQKLESKRLQEAVERKKHKEALKAMETPEEKRARRLREKQAKELKRRERMGWDTEYQHYTNEDNPFGDANLTSTFVWQKKLEVKGLTNLRDEEIEIINRQKQMENKAELEKVKKRRLERELEMAQREEEMALLQRSREAAEFQEWERQEDQFHLEQARLRSKIRIQDGRAKPIDLLAQYVSTHSLEETIEMQMHEPYTYLNGLGIEDLEDLLEDIRVYMEMDKSGENTGYWVDLTIIASDELQKLKKMELGSEYHAVVGNREGINHSVARDVTSIFQGKTAQQLDELKLKIESKLSGKEDGVDIGYWESLLSQLKAHMARARLRDRHQENLRKKLEMLKSEQVETDEPMQTDQITEEPSTSSIKREPTEEENDDSSQDIDKEDEEAMDLLSDCFALYKQGNYSPEYVPEDSMDSNIRIIDADQLEVNIEKVRNRVLNRAEDVDDEDFATKEEMRLAKVVRDSLGVNAEEAEFSVETKLDSEVYLWSDKYRPRKPRYFNRVHTGFEWNKYNQTHYDMDNPPPKIVQGYKFNIFYPDLIDKNSTPQYFLVRMA